MLLISGTSHPALSQKLAKKLKLKLSPIEIKKFACQETYVKIKEKVKGQTVFVLQTATHNVNEELIELFLICDALRRQAAKSISVIMPHFPYSRQDRVAEAGETISAKLIADLLTASGMSHLISFDLHSEQIQGFFDVPVNNLPARPLFVKYFKKKNLKNAVVVATDAGAAKMAKRFADDLDYDLVFIHKERSAHNQSAVLHLVGDIKNKIPIIYDDLIDTAGSVVNAAQTLREQGSQDEIYIAATHAVFSEPATKRLFQAELKEIVVTDTIPFTKARKLKNLTVLSVGEMIAKIV